MLVVRFGPRPLWWGFPVPIPMRGSRTQGPGESPQGEGREPGRSGGGLWIFFFFFFFFFGGAGAPSGSFSNFPEVSRDGREEGNAIYRSGEPGAAVSGIRPRLEWDYGPAPASPAQNEKGRHWPPPGAVSSPDRSSVVHTACLPAMHFLTLISACCLLAGALAAEVKKPAAAAAPGVAEKLSPKAATLAERSAGLAFSLYQAMAKDQAVENILLSPVVVASSLGLVSLGGKAATASQAKAVLSAEQLRDEEVHAGLGELLRTLSNNTARNVTWKLGSRLYGPSSVSFAEDFVRSSKQHYNCEHSKINFRDKRSALQSINEWAAQTTDGKLPEVTKDVERTDGALLVNAMFFKPHWDERFHHKMVDNRGFMVTRSYTVGVTMMHRTGLYNYYDDEKEKLQIVEMPLAHKLSSLIILMPHHVEPLERLEKLLTKEQLKSWMGKMQKKAVAISLPKGVVEVTHDLQKHLAGLGLTEAIDKNKADLSRMSGKKDLYLASVFHATAFEWDTEGNPFDQDIYGREELRSPKLFYADHPFIFLVRDTQSGSLLFIGRLVRPKGDKMRDEL
uniref:Serpin H1 n=2 Tax=Suricata suricatta TaxID=37032 RepID=A0A673TKE9_SURSU